MFPKTYSQVRELMQRRQPALAKERCEVVVERIRKDPSLKLVAVLDEDGQPMGTIDRQTVLTAVSHPLHYAVLQNRPITQLLEREFCAIEADSSIDRLCAHVAEINMSLKQGGMVVTENGEYVGVLDNSDLLDHVMRLNAARRKELSAAHETVMDSVNYASRIQHGLLPNSGRLRSLFKGVGVLWEPRDVVGGDIYWLSPVSPSGCFWVALVDCTGHGVPGAMVSMLLSSSLERVFDASPNLSPGQALARLGDVVRHALHQDFEGACSDDGFDAALLKFNPRAGEITFAGARIGIYLVPKGNEVVSRINGTKSALGYKGTAPHDCLPEIVLKMDDLATIVMATDGVFDQPGGPYCRAFGPARWLASIEACRTQAPEKMVVTLESTLSEWRGHESQRDDQSALVLGL